MTSEHYKVVFSAEAIPEKDLAQVKSKLSSLLKLESEKFEHLFSGKQVVIRKDVDHQTALQYKKAFERAGATCKLVKIHQTEPESIEEEEANNLVEKKLLEQWQGQDKYDDPEKRKFARLVCPSSKRPSLKTKEHELEVIDISEEGLKLSDYPGRGFGEKVYGTLELLSGQAVGVTGEIAWQDQNEFGLHTTRIPRSIIIEEIRTLIRKIGSIIGVQEADVHTMIICPNCGFEQKQSEECIKCEIIISKYLEKKINAGALEAATNNQQEAESLTAGLPPFKEDAKKTGIGYAWLLDKLLPEKLKYLFRNYFTRKNPYFNYLAKVLDILIQAAFLLLITAIVFTGLMYMSKMAWNIYIAVPVGKKFLQMFAETAQGIFYLFNRDLIRFSTQLTTAAFTICLAISAICQVLHIARYFYLPRGFFGKIALWGLPLAAVVAIYIQAVFGVKQFKLAYVVALVPTLFVFAGCFRFTYELLPEVGEIVQKALQIKTKIF